MHNGAPNRIMLHGIRRWVMHMLIRAMLLSYAGILALAKLLGKPPRALDEDGLDILITGTFHSENWIKSHLWPLSLSRRVKRIRMVASSPVPSLSKVEGLYPPKWLARVAGTVPARLLTFLWVGWRTRPDVVAGFHLLLNGMCAALLGEAIGARSLYICGGGPAEVADGGIMSENRLFQKLETPDTIVEHRLLGIVRDFDLIITMGHRSAQYFRARGVKTSIFVIAGGRDGQRFHPRARVQLLAPETDLIFTGRLASIKRVDLFLSAIAEVARSVPDIRAAIIGEGPLATELRTLARNLGIEKNVIFAGQQDCVEAWLAHSKIFVLTSDSEGLSLALMEAMLCGLTAVVSDVGDLCELVEDGVNGYLIAERDPASFAEKIAQLLTDAAKREQFSVSARQSAERFDVHAAAQLWDQALAPEVLDRSLALVSPLADRAHSGTQKGAL